MKAHTDYCNSVREAVGGQFDVGCDCPEVEAPTQATTALECALSELDHVLGLWRESEATSRDFQMMLMRLCRRIEKGLPLDQALAQAKDLLARKHTMSILRDS